MLTDGSNVGKLEERAWHIFALHAAQRLTAFNFYIILASLLVTALAATFQKDFPLRYLGSVVGALLTTISYLFWRLDIRNRELIKLAEEVLKHFESTVPSIDGFVPYHPGAYFLREEAETKRQKAGSRWYWRRHYSYRNTLNRIYLVFASVGIIGVVLGITTTR